LWISFNNFSEKLTYDTKVEALVIKDFSKNIIHPLSFLKNIFNSFQIEINPILNLENKLETLENKLSNLPSNENVIDFSESKVTIENDILEINKCFSEILKIIQDL
jgi:hypothetical protein